MNQQICRFDATTNKSISRSAGRWHIASRFDTAASWADSGDVAWWTRIGRALGVPRFARTTSTATHVALIDAFLRCPLLVDKVT